MAKWARLKGASRIIEIDKYRHRLQNKLGIRLQTRLSVDGLDVATNCATPKTMYHKIQRTLLETDTPEAINEMLVSTKK